MKPRSPDALKHCYACILASACNFGFMQMQRMSGLTYRKMAWHATWYLREETLKSAFSELVNFHSRLPLTTLWGGGTLSSSDGQRFPVSVKTGNAVAIPKYFGYGRGLTYYTWTSDQYSQYGTKVIASTIRDATYVLDEILDNETELTILEHTTDTAGYTDLVFGLFDLLGLQFSPRLADLADKKLYRIDKEIKYKNINSLITGKINIDLILRHWDELLRIAGSLKLALNRQMLDSWKETIDVTSVGSNFASKNQNANNSGRLVSIGNMNTARAGHTATQLSDGGVLIVGGIKKPGEALSSAEIYEPETKRFLPTGSMSNARFGHTATLLPNGKVLIVGGADSSESSLSSAEIYNPATGVFTSAGNLNVACTNHQATLLNDGRVLITGGVDSNHSALSSVEVYDKEKGVFLATGNMNAPREFHTATLLKDGNVLITGGSTGKLSAETTLSSVELYNFSTSSFVPIGNMTEKRYSHAATLLADGRVLVIGGSTGREWKDRTSSAEIYDPPRKSFIKTGDMSLPRFNHQAATLELSNGRILIAGAGARLEVFNPASNTFSSTGGNVGTGRIFSTATLLTNGEVLITGGYNFDYPPTASAWIYSP